MADPVYKVFRPAEWAAFQAAGRFDGSVDDLRDGYIHMSALPQLRATIAKYYLGEAEIVLAAVDPDRLAEADLRWEESRGGALFPHLYQPLLASHVAAAKTLDPAIVAAMEDAAVAALLAPL